MSYPEVPPGGSDELSWTQTAASAAAASGELQHIKKKGPPLADPVEQKIAAAAEPQMELPGKEVEQPREGVKLPGEQSHLHAGAPDIKAAAEPQPGQVPHLHTGTPDMMERRPPSPVVSMVSMKSDDSMDLPLNFRREQGDARRLPSAVPNVVSVRSNASIDVPVNFRREVPSSTANPVRCDVSGCPYPAVKSCVTCGDSYCRTCITPHYTDPDLERHQLQDLQQQEQQSLCTEHRRELEFFCTTDQTAICSRCLLHRHKGHDAIEQVPRSGIITQGGLPPPGELQFAKVSPDSVTLQWSPAKGTPGPHMYNVIRRQGQEHCSLRTSNSQVKVTGLHPGQKYHFSVATLSQDGRQSTPVEGIIQTELPVPENLTVAADLSGVSLKWTKPEGVDQVSYLLELFREDQEEPAMTIHAHALQHYISDLQYGINYTAQLSTQKNELQSQPISNSFAIEIPVPECLDVIFINASTARISWQVPTEMQKTPHSFLVSYRSRGTAPKSISTESCSTDITGLTPGTDYTVRVYTELQHGGKSQPASTDMRTGITLSELLYTLGLRDLQGGKLTLSSVLEISNFNTLCDTPAQGLHQLPLTFLKKLIMSNLNARNTQCLLNQVMHSGDCTEDNGYCDAINPLDLITALFHCADPFLKQEMVSKMSLCQFAVPLLLPNCDTQQSTLMLWAMRDIVKNYRPHSGEGAFVEGRIVEMEIPMVSFVRVGKSSLSKSQTLNKFLSNSSQHNEAFIHHDMPCGDVPRRISDGLVEVTWYLPCGNENIDIFTQPVAIANLRGDSRSFEAQVSFLCQTSAAVFIFSDDLEGDLNPFTIMEKKAELFLVTNSQREDVVDKLKTTCRQHNVKEEHVIIRKKRNESGFLNMLRLLVKDFVESNFVKTNMFNSAESAQQILVDEDSRECRNARQNAEGISEMVKNVVKFKEEQLPLHGTIWKEISQLEKERCRMRKANTDQGIEHYKSSLKTQELKLRKEQQQSNVSEVMAKFIAGISQPRTERLYFLTWLKIKLDTLTRHDLANLRLQYKDCCINNPQNKDCIQILDEQISNCSLGPEHFFRELGQLYECACSLPEDNLARQQVQHLPGLCAQMLLDGFPVELVDGDASNIPMKWISAVLTELHQLVDTKSKILVLTVLGVQGTGKSTLLNTMFGVQFAVSSGRCTRGAFMLLMKVSEELRPELNCDFIMVIDTEGLKSPELAALDTSYEHDNELATLVIGLSDITMINVAMENNQEMKDVLQIAVHAFLRMKEVGKKPRCLFVHQNVSDMSAHDKNMRDRNKLVEQLNEMTQAAAKMEKKEANTKFTDVMKYDPDQDSYYIPGLWHGTPPMSPVNTGYSEAVYKLKKNLISLFKSDEELCCKNAAEFQKLTDSLWKCVKFENFIFNFRNSLVADAYSDVCTHYNRWEWAFQSEMNKWLIAKTTKISNFGVTDDNSDISQLQATLREMLHEGSETLDQEQQKLQENLEQYFKQNENKVRLVEKYREDFYTSGKRIRQQTEHSLRQSLEQAVEIRKGMEKVNTIKDKQTKTIETKVLELIKHCYGRGADLSEDELKEEFDKMWTESMSELLIVELQQTHVCQNALHLLKKNLSAKSGRVSEILSQVDIKTSGQGEFIVKEEWFSKWDDRGKRILSAIRYADTTLFLVKRQNICNDIITECHSLVQNRIDAMTRDNTDYSDAYIQELFKCIDDEILRIKISNECEAYLKIHVIGFAACNFQKAHDEFRYNNDPREHLKQSRDTFLDCFLARFYEKDQFLKKAEEFSGSVKPTVQVPKPPGAIERKIFELIKHCWERNTDLSEHELNKEFDNMWNEIMSEMPKLQQADGHQNALYILKENLKEKGEYISEMLSKADLKTSGQGHFTLKRNITMYDRLLQKMAHPEKSNDSNHQAKQAMCNDIITTCRTLVNDRIENMKRNNTDYNDDYMRELCKCIDDKIPQLRISDECEAHLKMYVIGSAANDFQKAHYEHLKQSRDTFLESFKAVFSKNDQCSIKAKQFAETCVKPAVQNYISKHLGQAIANEMKTGDEGMIYNTQSTFQFAMLKQLIEEKSFHKYKTYIRSYEAFVKDWIKQQTIARMSASGQLPQLEKRLLSDIVNKINHAISSPAGAAGRGIKDFIHQFCSALQDQLTIPRDAYNKFLFLLILISVDVDRFTSNLKQFIKEMEEALAQDYERRISHKDIIVRIEQLPSKPHDLLFSILCGCGHQCPFCGAPCDAGCRSHTKHESRMHRPEGLGRYRWDDSKKLVIDICTTLVISDCKFKNFRTKEEWHPYKQYREIYPDWDIAGDASAEASDYWKYVMKEFNKELAKYYNAKPADIPDEWMRLTKEDALRDLKKTFNME